jgi:hypothetical protein
MIYNCKYYLYHIINYKRAKYTHLSPEVYLNITNTPFIFLLNPNLPYPFVPSNFRLLFFVLKLTLPFCLLQVIPQNLSLLHYSKLNTINIFRPPPLRPQVLLHSKLRFTKWAIKPGIPFKIKMEHGSYKGGLCLF